jgi:hypothetical protein
MGRKCAFGDVIHETHCEIQINLEENDSIPNKPDMFQILERSYEARHVVIIRNRGIECGKIIWRCVCRDVLLVW